jgi:hypothetical protein
MTAPRTTEKKQGPPGEGATGHQHHFLSRLDRVSLPHVELALELYRDHELLRFLLRGAALPEGEGRVAISLADPQEGPFLVVTREGRFVTCLGEGMRVDELPVITRVQLDGAIVRFTDSRAKHEERLRIRASGGGADALLDRICTAADELTAEDIQSLAAFQPLFAVAFLKHCVEMARVVFEIKARLLALLRRTERPKPHLHPALRTYWQSFWAVGHLAVLGSMGGARTFERCPQVPETCCRALTSGTMFHGTFRLAQMGIWSVAKLGKPVLGAYKELYDTAPERRQLVEAALALAALGLRHGKLEAEVRKAVSPTPPKGHPEMAGLAAKLSENVRRVLDDPEKYTAMQRRMGADFAVRWAPAFPPGSPLRFERAEDVPEDLALRFSLQDTKSLFHDTSRLNYLLACLPWLGRAPAESLYLPAEVIRAIHRPWRPEDTLRLVQPWVESAKEERRAPRPEGPSRQGPCPCGSGKKYKRCCENSA